jgi:hypothetical protein
MPPLPDVFRRLLRSEPYIFLLLLLVHVSVLFRYEWYPTLDGPAHLYNAILIKQILLGNEFLARYLEFSSFPEPNWSGHALMAVLSLFLPANWVEKGMVLIIFTFTAYGFRAFVRTQTDRPTFAPLLIFPFLCSFTLRIGFFNFSLSIAILLWLLTWWVKQGSSSTWRTAAQLFLFLGLLYFSHALTAIIGIGVVLLWSSTKAFEDRSFQWRSLKTPIIASLPCLLLIVVFISRSGGNGYIKFETAVHLLKVAADGVPFTLHYGPAMIWAARVIAATLLLFTIMILIDRYRRSSAIVRSDLWLLCAIVAAIGYFVLPDSVASGGIMSVRYLLFFYVFLVLWLAVQQWRFAFTLLLIPYLAADLFLVRVDHRFTAELDRDVANMRAALPKVRSNSAVLPIVHSNYWFHTNFSNYLGTERGILVLDNYEAMAPHFPLRWKPAHRPPQSKHPSFYDSALPCVNIEELEDSMSMDLDHVLRWKYDPALQDSCTIDLQQQLVSGFRLVHQRSEVELFIR